MQTPINNNWHALGCAFPISDGLNLKKKPIKADECFKAKQQHSFFSVEDIL